MKKFITIFKLFVYKIYINIYVNIAVHYHLYTFLLFIFLYSIIVFKYNIIVLEDYQDDNPPIQRIDLSKLLSDETIWNNMSEEEKRQIVFSRIGNNQDYLIKMVKVIDNYQDLVNLDRMILKYSESKESNKLDYVSDISQWEKMNYDNYSVDTTFNKFLLYILCSIGIIYLVYIFFPFSFGLFDMLMFSYKEELKLKIMLMQHDHDIISLFNDIYNSYFYIKYNYVFKRG